MCHARTTRRQAKLLLWPCVLLQLLKQVVSRIPTGARSVCSDTEHVTKDTMSVDGSGAAGELAALPLPHVWQAWAQRSNPRGHLPVVHTVQEAALVHLAARVLARQLSHCQCLYRYSIALAAQWLQPKTRCSNCMR